MYWFSVHILMGKKTVNLLKSCYIWLSEHFYFLILQIKWSFFYHSIRCCIAFNIFFTENSDFSDTFPIATSKLTWLDFREMSPQILHRLALYVKLSIAPSGNTIAILICACQLLSDYLMRLPLNVFRTFNFQHLLPF